jgi:predicted metal-dependent hydrolase
VEKSHRIAPLRVEGIPGLDPHYAGWFACFNRGDYFEAHDVLEDLWLRERGQPNDAFYKGLIQLAGAFVHLRKGRLRPADALFRLAATNLSHFPATHLRLDVARVLALIQNWRDALEAGSFEMNPLNQRVPPSITPESCTAG